MSTHGRARSASVPDSNPEVGVARDGTCTAGTSSPFSAEQKRDALRSLINVGRMIRRTNGAYGTTQAEMMTNAMANHLKARRLACPGYNHEIFPTAKGKKYAEESL